MKPTLSVLMAVHERGGLAAATLEVVRPLADEIIVAFDSRTPDDQLGPLDKVADVLVGFEFSGANRFRPWLREQARGEWLLLLDGDEVVSTQLSDMLPELIARKDISGYWLPRWWIFPDPTRRLFGPPWERDEAQMRLVRNDGRLWFPGVKHTGAVCDGPTRIVDAPLIHLALLLDSNSRREEKVRRYNDEKFPLFTFEGQLVNEAYYLPERDPAAQTTPIPVEDAARVDAILAKRCPSTGLKRPVKIVPAEEVEKWWTGRPTDDLDCRAEIEVLPADTSLLTRSTVIFDLDVTNRGRSVWFASDLSRGGALVVVSYHWRANKGSIAVWDGLRTKLTSRILARRTGANSRLGANASGARSI